MIAQDSDHQDTKKHGRLYRVRYKGEHHSHDLWLPAYMITGDVVEDYEAEQAWNDLRKKTCIFSTSWWPLLKDWLCPLSWELLPKCGTAGKAFAKAL